jgi:hypothetical protein
MSTGMTSENRQALIDALNLLAAAIEANPPPIIGSDIFVQAGPGASAVGSSISVTAGRPGSSGVGQRISVVAGPGQSVIGQRVTVIAGGDGAVRAPAPGAGSPDEVSDAISQLRDAAQTLASSPASKGWIESTLNKVSGWGSSALSGAISGASNAAMRFYLTGA